MPTASSLTLLRLFAVAFLLLLGSGKDERARITEHRDGSTTRGVATANLSVALATTPVQKDVDTAQPQLSASEANLRVVPLQSAPAPTRIHQWLFSCERATGQAARPPPFQA
jgi:hypothetical protein